MKNYFINLYLINLQVRNAIKQRIIREENCIAVVGADLLGQLEANQRINK